MTTAEQLAAKLDGRETRNEITHAEAQEAAENRLLVVYGRSDDLAELMGFVDDEVDVGDGGTFKIDRLGLFHEWTDECDDKPRDEAREYFEREPLPKITVDAIWNGSEPPAVWSYEVDGAPSYPFTILEDGEPYCIGVVIDCAGVME